MSLRLGTATSTTSTTTSVMAILWCHGYRSQDWHVLSTVSDHPEPDIVRSVALRMRVARWEVQQSLTMQKRYRRICVFRVALQVHVVGQQLPHNNV